MTLIGITGFLLHIVSDANVCAALIHPGKGRDSFMFHPGKREASLAAYAEEGNRTKHSISPDALSTKAGEGGAEL